jgi:rhodanese-related sulfurtransferase
MAQFIEFLGNHPILAGCWLVAFAGILVYHQRTGSKGATATQAIALINRNDALVVDIRDKKDFDEGHIVDALHIPAAKLEQRVTELAKHKGKPIVVVCKHGQQAGESVKKLEAAGHDPVYKLNGGMAEWKGQSLPVVTK